MKCCFLYRDSDSLGLTIPERPYGQELMTTFVDFINRTSHWRILLNFESVQLITHETISHEKSDAIKKRRLTSNINLITYITFEASNVG